MTPSDLERAKDFADFLRSNHCISAHDKPATMTGAVYGGSINEQGHKEIAKLITEVRNETLADVVEVLQSALVAGAHVDGIDLNKIQTTTQIIAIIEAMKTQNTDKEGEK